jgi:IS5 family transposase
MKPKKQERSGCDDLFRMRLEQILDQRHALYRLSGKIDWVAVEERFGVLYSEEGRPGIPIRLMVGLHYLKHAFNESDETVVDRWVENPYWQHVCGEEYFRHAMPINPSQMTRFCGRIGEEGCELMLGLTVVAGIKTKTVSKASVALVNVDTPVQDKAIAFPTDARLYHKARGALVRLAKQMGIDLRQSYERVSKRALMMNGRYAHARQMRRARREQKRLRTCLGRVIRDIERKLAAQQIAAGQEHPRLKRLLEIANRIHAQQRHDKGKVYSVHAPEVECIAKGKAHKPYEFGVKVGVVSTSKESFVVGMRSLPGNPLRRTHAQGITATGAETDGDRSERSLCGPRLPGSWFGGTGQSVDCRRQTWRHRGDQKEAQAPQCRGTGDRAHEERWPAGEKLPQRHCR